MLPVHYPGDWYGSGTLPVIEETIQRLAALPGVERAAATTGAMVDGVIGWATYQVGGTNLRADGRVVTVEYLEAAGTRLLIGQWLGTGKGEGRELVVNETFARRVWLDLHLAAGQVVRTNTGAVFGQIVGVIEDEPIYGLGKAPRPTTYARLEPFDRCRDCTTLVNYLVRMPRESELPDLASVVRAVMPRAAVGRPEWMSGRLFESIRQEAFVTVVLQLFVALAAVVSLCGMAGTARIVSRERQVDAAIRVAMGAPRLRVVYAQLRGAAAGILAGAAVGGVLAPSLSQAIAQQLPGTMIGGWWWSVVGIAGIVAIGCAGLAWPAWRAAAIDPATLLRTLDSR